VAQRIAGHADSRTTKLYDRRGQKGLPGMALLSAHKFSIGDWIMVEGKPAEVVEMDWRTVTLRY
jgi:hypothetical protein